MVYCFTIEQCLQCIGFGQCLEQILLRSLLVAYDMYLEIERALACSKRLGKLSAFASAHAFCTGQVDDCEMVYVMPSQILDAV